jgi:uncharacterized protein (DUF433 family)
MGTRYITSNSEIQGGAPVITGTRIPAARMIELVKQGYDEKNIKREFGNSVTMAKLRGALSELTTIGLEHYAEVEQNESRSAHA